MLRLLRVAEGIEVADHSAQRCEEQPLGLELVGHDGTKGEAVEADRDGYGDKLVLRNCRIELLNLYWSPGTSEEMTTITTEACINTQLLMCPAGSPIHVIPHPWGEWGVM